MVGIILAGGMGTRLKPITDGVSKQLLNVYNKPMIYYPLSTLMLAGIREIVIIVTKQHLPSFKEILGDGSKIGINLRYKIQDKPNGIAEGILLSKEEIRGKKVALILGDNIFHGSQLGSNLKSFTDIVGALIFGYRVSDPQNYGVIELNKQGSAVSIEEKPLLPKSNLAVPGLYFYDEMLLKYAEIIVPSARGELEITDINNLYLEDNKLKVKILERGTTWLDTGTFETLHMASSYIKTIEDRQGLKISVIEEIAFRNGWITDKALVSLAKSYANSPYGDYLMEIAVEKSL
jgi:glucose-1-phosphate thymidylyltransferase